MTAQGATIPTDPTASAPRSGGDDETDRSGSSSNKKNRRPAAFLDRDGTLNVDVSYASRPDQIVWIEGAAAALRRLNAAGWWVFVVTNQSGVARGMYDEATVEALHDWMAADLARQGARVDAFYYCPHHATKGVGRYRVACDCRKPAPGLLLRAMADYPVDVGRSFMLGDRQRDVEAGQAAGVAAHLYTGGDLDAVVAALMRQPTGAEPKRITPNSAVGRQGLE